MKQIGTWNPEKPFFHGACFDPKDGAGATGNSVNINYLGFVVFMPPAKFLSLCHPLEDVRKSATVFEKLIPQGICIAPPMLYLQKQGDGDPYFWRVRGHEGRHRALACKRLGIETIPVSCYPQGFRSRDMKEIIESGELTVIRNENNTRFISFVDGLVGGPVVIDKKVYINGGEWVSPYDVSTTPIQEKMVDWDGHYYYSKRNPRRRRG